jgi:hypothetical protein
MRKIQARSIACQPSNEIEKEEREKIYIYHNNKTETYSSLNKRKEFNKIEKAI